MALSRADWQHVGERETDDEPRRAARPVSRTATATREGRPENARPRDRFGAPLPRGSVDELAHRQEPEEVVSTVAEALDEAVALFDEQRFFEAHEFLEYVWKSDEIPRRGPRLLEGRDAGRRRLLSHRSAATTRGL